MIVFEREQPKLRSSAYASLSIRTAKDRCVAIALATVSLTSSLILLAGWIGTHTLSYSRELFFYMWICSDIEPELGAFNFPTTVLCILGICMIAGWRWRALFACCAMLGTICFCLTAFYGQMARE
jgi:hypothetical protein